MLITFSSEKNIDQITASLEEAIKNNQFGLMGVHNLQETMKKKGVDFNQPCLIFEVCQPRQAKKVLDENMEISTALPCRISIYKKEGKTVLATIKPTVLLAMFETPQLKEVAQEVEETLIKIMEEAVKQ